MNGISKTFDMAKNKMIYLTENYPFYLLAFRFVFWVWNLVFEMKSPRKVETIAIAFRFNVSNDEFDVIFFDFVCRNCKWK